MHLHDSLLISQSGETSLFACNPVITWHRCVPGGDFSTRIVMISLKKITNAQFPGSLNSLISLMVKFGRERSKDPSKFETIVALLFWFNALLGIWVRSKIQFLPVTKNPTRHGDCEDSLDVNWCTGTATTPLELPSMC